MLLCKHIWWLVGDNTNKGRTAEQLFKYHHLHNARSACTSGKAWIG
jgi:hypothetical protein